MVKNRRLIGMLAAIVTLAGAQVAHAGVVAPGSIVEGKTIAEWTGDWWNWLVKEPFATNPAADPTGAFANLNQSGPVFFVAGSFGGPTDPRTFSVSADKYLLIPLVNYVFWAPEDGADEAAIRTRASDNADSVTNPYFELDGVALANPENYREATPAGGFTLTYGPLLADVGLSNMDRLAVSDGYWVMLEPLSAGNHTLRFGGQGTFDGANPFSNDVVVNLTVTPVPEPGSLALLAMGAVGLIGYSRRRR